MRKHCLHLEQLFMVVMLLVSPLESSALTFGAPLLHQAPLRSSPPALQLMAFVPSNTSKYPRRSSSGINNSSVYFGYVCGIQRQSIKSTHHRQSNAMAVEKKTTLKRRCDVGLNMSVVGEGSTLPLDAAAAAPPGDARPTMASRLQAFEAGVRKW